MTKVISIANQKGGVGKTSTAINLSASIAALEKKTLVIDIDPQGNSSSGMGLIPETDTIYEVLVNNRDIRECVENTYLPYLDMLPANINLVGAEVELVNVAEREFRLRKVLDKIKNNYDYIFIDCPPSLGLLTLNALTASDSVIIPVQCEYFALEGLGQLLNTINTVKKYFNNSLIIEGVLLTMFDTRLRLSHQVVEEVRKYFGDKVFKSIIRRNVRISEAPSHAKPVLLYDALSQGAKDYIALAEELISKNSPEIMETENNEQD